MVYGAVVESVAMGRLETVAGTAAEGAEEVDSVVIVVDDFDAQ